jgi:hypothetical protein
MSKSLPLVAMLAIACAAGLAGCAAARRDKAVATERLLTAAGFQMRIADTPDETVNLQTLPQREIFREQHEGKSYYVYADGKYCSCVYVGSAEAYQRYEKLAVEKEIAEANLRAARINQSNAMRWGAWGPWYSPWY